MLRNRAFLRGYKHVSDDARVPVHAGCLEKFRLKRKKQMESCFAHIDSVGEFAARLATLLILLFFVNVGRIFHGRVLISLKKPRRRADLPKQ